jgi:hypothetical protein
MPKVLQILDRNRPTIEYISIPTDGIIRHGTSSRRMVRRLLIIIILIIIIIIETTYTA